MGPMFFTIKESYKTRIMQRQREKDEKQNMEKQMKEFAEKQQKQIDTERALRLGTDRPSRLAIATPGARSTSGATPKRTPLRIGL